MKNVILYSAIIGFNVAAWNAPLAAVVTVGIIALGVGAFMSAVWVTEKVLDR